MIEKVIVVPIILNLVSLSEESIKSENFIDVPVYKQEILIPVSKKQSTHKKTKKRKSLDYKVSIYEDSKNLYLKISIPKKYLKNKKTINPPST